VQALGDLYWATHRDALHAGGAREPMRPASERVTACAALRNVVAFCTVAKLAAVEAGLHTALLAHVQEAHGWLVMSALSPQQRSSRGAPGHGRAAAAVVVTAAAARGRAKGTGAPGKKAAAAEEAERAAVDAGAADARGAKLLELVAALSVLKHLVYSADGGTADEQAALGEVRAAVVAAGAAEAAAALWSFALTEPPVLHELLGLLANLGHHCEAARRATAVERAAGTGAPSSLVARLMRLAGSPTLPAPTFVLATLALQTLVLSPEPLALFVRANMGAECEQLLRRAVSL
jgi:hypothetical protein